MATGVERNQTLDRGDLTELPGHLLRRCHQISVALFHDECAGFDITPLQFAVLTVLKVHGAKDQASIGGLAALDRTTVAVVVQKLEDRDLVRRMQSDQDRRAKIVSITAAGLTLLSEVSKAVARVEGRTLAPLSEGEAREFTRLLRKLAEGNNTHSRAPMKQRKR